MAGRTISTSGRRLSSTALPDSPPPPPGSSATRRMAIPFYCPVNEISFHAWGGGDAACLNPYTRGRGFELKVQLARASIAAMHEILAVDPRARFVHCEPAINIAARPVQAASALRGRGRAAGAVPGFRHDRRAPLASTRRGGEAARYRRTQLLPRQPVAVRRSANRPPTIRSTSPFATSLPRPMPATAARCFVAETGTEGDVRAAWFSMMVSEVEAARSAGVPVEGICLYPIIDHVGWDDDRDCPSGLLSSRVVNGRREVHAPLAAAIERWNGRTRTWFWRVAAMPPDEAPVPAHRRHQRLLRRLRSRPGDVPSVADAAADWLSGERGPSPAIASSSDISCLPPSLADISNDCPSAAVRQGLCESAEIWTFWAREASPPWSFDPPALTRRAFRPDDPGLAPVLLD